MNVFVANVPEMTTNDLRTKLAFFLIQKNTLIINFLFLVQGASVYI
jgi:hypothetical protein